MVLLTPSGKASAASSRLLINPTTSGDGRSAGVEVCGVEGEEERYGALSQVQRCCGLPVHDPGDMEENPHASLPGSHPVEVDS